MTFRLAIHPGFKNVSPIQPTEEGGDSPSYFDPRIQNEAERVFRSIRAAASTSAFSDGRSSLKGNASVECLEAASELDGSIRSFLVSPFVMIEPDCNKTADGAIENPEQQTGSTSMGDDSLIVDPTTPK